MYESPSNLPPESRSELAALLNARLAFAVGLAAFNDAIAERAVTLGGRAFGTARHVAGASTLPEYPRDATRDMDHVRLPVCANRDAPPKGSTTPTPSISSPR